MPTPVFTYTDPDSFQFSVEDIQCIYDRCMDDLSKEIFLNRFLYSCTGSWKYMRKVICTSKLFPAFQNELSRYRGVYIYGAGLRGSRLKNLISDVHWMGFIDKKKNGIAEGIRIFKPDEISEIADDCAVVISNGFGVREIRNDLVNKGMDPDRIYALEDYNDRENIYFDSDLDIYGDINGCFVDAGAYDGNDSIRFIDRVGKGRDSKVIVLEPENDSFNACKEKLQRYANCEFIRAGLSNHEGVMRFGSGKGMSSSCDENGEDIPVVTLDAITKSIPVGMIKMDIEGEEKAALFGGKDVIREQKPLLAVSVYHKRSDIVEIMKLIVNLNKGYRFYLRHYSVATHDTVLYAI